MEDMYQSTGQMQWPSSLDELQRYYDPSLQIPFGYNGSSMLSDTPFQTESHIMNSNGTSVGQQPLHQSIEHNTPTPREAECQDPSSRPRLTTDQTNILESKFQQDPKPPTDTKKELAQKIGLTLDKVNNWYQNRRAKAKNAKKNMETFGVLPVNENNTSWQYPSEYPNSSFAQQPHTATPVVSMSIPTHNGVNAGIGSVKQEDSLGSLVSAQHITIPHGSAELPNSEMVASIRQSQSFEEHLQQAYLEMATRFPSTWLEPGNLQREMVEEAQLKSTLRRIEENNIAMEVMQRTHKNHSNPYPSQIEVPQPTSPLSEWVGVQSRSLSPWATPIPAPADWSAPHQQDSPIEHQLLLQQSAMPELIQSYDSEQQFSSMESSVSSQTAPSTQSPESISYPAPLVSNEQTLYQSPSPAPFVSLAQPQPERVVARRGSDSSELASNFDTIHLQKVQSHQSQHNSDGEVFKTPQLPQMSLANRRKKRPVALGAVGMRSQSCIGTENPSPLSKTMSLGSASSVRRIKSTGNSLNVIGGRIQKSGFASAQRSPLNFSTFQEAEALHHINQYAAPSPNSQSTSTNEQVPMTPQTPSAIGDQPPIDWNKSLGHSTSNPNMFQAQQYHSSPFNHHAASPPGTPYQHLPAYMQHPHAHLMAPPQSAPAHMTHFPNFSPPFQATPGTPAGYFPPVPVSHDSFQYPPVPHALPGHGPMFEYQPRLDMYGYQQPHIMNNSPPFPTFFGIPPPPQPTKELEVVMTTFPKPAESNSPPKEPHRPKQFTFQNSGPQDFP